MVMESNWAAEHLQVIRTLMERSAVYRRALAPIMLVTGSAGILGSLVGVLAKCDSNAAFILLWLGVAVVSLIGSLLLVRRQALNDSEPVWSAPSRRVAQALLPAFSVGLTVAMLALIVTAHGGMHDGGMQFMLVMLWSWFYGCAAHAAGFFMPRGVRWLGWIYVLSGTGMLVGISYGGSAVAQISPHIYMGAIFGGQHLAYGIYLYLTEKKSPIA